MGPSSRKGWRGMQGQTVAIVALQGSNGLGLKISSLSSSWGFHQDEGWGGLNTHETHEGKKGRLWVCEIALLSAHMMMMHHHRQQNLRFAGSPAPLEKWWVSKLNIYVWQVEDVKKLQPLLLQQLADPFAQMAGFRWSSTTTTSIY
jgi:hypothetical protein